MALVVAHRGSTLLPRLKRSRPKYQSRYPTPYAESSFRTSKTAAADGLTTLLHTTLRLAPLRAKTFTRQSILLLLN